MYSTNFSLFWIHTNWTICQQKLNGGHLYPSLGNINRNALSSIHPILKSMSRSLAFVVLMAILMAGVYITGCTTSTPQTAPVTSAPTPSAGSST